MRSRRRHLAVAVVVLLVGGTVSAQPGPGEMAFTVTVPDPASHVYHVTVRCDRLSGHEVEFRMPAWTPGYYGLFDFAGNVRNFGATDGAGRPLAWAKAGANGWRVTSAGDPVITLAYDVVASKPFVANAYVDETRGYITPGALFVYVPGQLRRPVTVTIERAPGWSTIATGLDPVSPSKPNTFFAPDFDVLYDSPILMGNLERLPSFEIRGIRHDFVGFDLGEFDRERFVADLKAVVEAGTRIIGEIPYSHYTFIAIGPGQGGIEHVNSTAFAFTGVGADRAARLRTLSFLAHEYFHTYNVKRIRPIALGPFDYDRENVTNMLWVSEGFTVYYEYLMLARSGTMTREELLDAMRRIVASYESGTGRLFQSATQASAETWAQGPFGRGREKGVRRTISYYEKGPILGMLLDFAIRHESKNERSLDTVMRALYRKYYKELGRGWTDAEFREACERAAGGRLDEVFDYAATTKAIDYGKYLAFAGLEMERPKELPAAYLGALVEDVGGSVTVVAVEPDTAAERAGLARGDVIARLGSGPVDVEGLSTAIAAGKPGTRLTLAVSRGGATRGLEVVLGHAVERTFTITPIANPDPLQAAILASWAAR